MVEWNSKNGTFFAPLKRSTMSVVYVLYMHFLTWIDKKKQQNNQAKGSELENIRCMPIKKDLLATPLEAKKKRGNEKHCIGTEKNATHLAQPSLSSSSTQDNLWSLPSYTLGRKGKTHWRNTRGNIFYSEPKIPEITPFQLNTRILLEMY